MFEHVLRASKSVSVCMSRVWKGHVCKALQKTVKHALNSVESVQQMFEQVLGASNIVRKTLQHSQMCVKCVESVQQRFETVLRASKSVIVCKTPYNARNTASVCSATCKNVFANAVQFHVCVSVRVCESLCVYECLCASLCVPVRPCASLCVSVRLCAPLCASVCVCVSVCLWVSVCLCVRLNA